MLLRDVPPGELVQIMPEETAPVYRIIERTNEGAIRVAKVGGRFDGQNFVVDATTVCRSWQGPAPRRQGVKVEREVNKRRKAGVLR